MTTPDPTLAAWLAEFPQRFMSKPSDHWRGEVLLPVVFADPGTNGFYYRERKPDSVAAYIRCDLIANALDAFFTTAEADALVEAAVLAERAAIADGASDRADWLDDQVKFGGGAKYIASLDGGAVELRRLYAAIRARGVTG